MDMYFRRLINWVYLVLSTVIMLGTFWNEKAQADFRNLGLAARPIAMGRAFVAVADDPTAIFFNPAGLIHQQAIGMCTTYGRLFPGIDDDGIHLADAAITLPCGRFFTFGAAATSLNVPSYNENIFCASAAKRLPLHFAVGVNVKLLRWSATGYYDAETGLRDNNFSKTTLSFDVGAIYISPELSETFLGCFIKNGRIQAGVFLSDITQPSIAENGSDAGRLPFGIDVGLAYVSEKITFAGSLLNRDERTRVRFGCEFTALSVFSSQWNTRILLRGGGNRMLSDHEGGEVDVGFGLSLHTINIDYAYLYPLVLEDLGGSHRVSLGYSF